MWVARKVAVRRPCHELGSLVPQTIIEVADHDNKQQDDVFNAKLNRKYTILKHHVLPEYLAWVSCQTSCQSTSRRRTVEGTHHRRQETLNKMSQTCMSRSVEGSQVREENEPLGEEESQ